MMEIEHLKQFNLVYVATPYSKFPTGLFWAFVNAATYTADLVRAGVKAYSPIAHTHPIAQYGHIDPLSHDIWLPFDEAMMRVSDALVVVQMEGWEESRGIKHEIDFFAAAGKPIFYLDIDTLVGRS